MSWRRRLMFLGCSFAVGVFSGFNNFSLSLWLTGITDSLLLIALLANTRGFLGSIVSPLAGAWSDRLWLGWLGRRRPFILAGGLLSAALLALTPAIQRLSLPGLDGAAGGGLAALGPVIIVLFAMTVAFNLMDDIHRALLPDLTREGAERNQLASWMVVVDMGGQVAILVLGFLISREGVPDHLFALAAGLVAGATLLTVLGVREPAPEYWLAQRGHLPHYDAPAANWRTLWTEYRPVLIFGLVIFAYWFGVNAVLPLVSIYTRDVLGASAGEAQLLPALMLLSTTLAAVPAGLVATHLGKRRVIAAGYVIMAVSALAGLVITTKEQGAALFLVAGIGNAASMVLTIPLLADLVPRQHMGAAAGFVAAAGGLAAPLSSVVGGTLADFFGPRAIFGLMACTVLIALLLLSRVREPATSTADSTLASSYV